MRERDKEKPVIKWSLRNQSTQLKLNIFVAFFRIKTDNFKTYLFKRKNIRIRSESAREGAKEFDTNYVKAIEQRKRQKKTSNGMETSFYFCRFFFVNFISFFIRIRNNTYRQKANETKWEEKKKLPCEWSSLLRAHALTQPHRFLALSTIYWASYWFYAWNWNNFIYLQVFFQLSFVLFSYFFSLILYLHLILFYFFPKFWNSYYN